MSMPQPSASLRVEPCREPTSLRAIRRVPQCTLRMRAPPSAGYPADRPKGRGQPRRSCGRRRFCGALLSLDAPSRQRWLACACIWRACRTRDPHLVTPTKAGETPSLHPQSSGRLARTQRLRKSRRVAMQRRGAARTHSNSRRRQRRSRSGRRRIVSPSVAAAMPAAAMRTPMPDGGCNRHPGWKQHAVTRVRCTFLSCKPRGWRSLLPLQVIVWSCSRRWPLGAQRQLLSS